jgi:copper chaperone CopZ
MERPDRPSGLRRTRAWGTFAVGAALTASICCTLPLVLAVAGVGGSLVAQLSSLSPLQAPLSALSVVVLGFAFWQSARTPDDTPASDATSAPDCACDEPRRKRGRAFLWGSAAVVAVLLTVPALVGLVSAQPDGATASGAPAGERDIVIRVDGMTCSSCATGLQATLRRTPGVVTATVTVEPPEARIRYDEALTSPAALVSAIEASGYTATLAAGAVEPTPNIAALLPVGERCNVRGHDHALDVEGAEPMTPITMAALRDAFNASDGDVRLVALLSPACPECVHGHDVVRGIMARNPGANLKGLVVWLPMVEGDSPRAATARAATLADSRLIAQGWDGGRDAGIAFERTLGLTRPAWDVYLVYAPGVRWEGEIPPTPTFWMHQLTEEAGADQRLCLVPEVLEQEVARLL